MTWKIQVPTLYLMYKTPINVRLLNNMRLKKSQSKTTEIMIQKDVNYKKYQQHIIWQTDIMIYLLVYLFDAAYAQADTIACLYSVSEN